jgi:hypothetical protein
MKRKKNKPLCRTCRCRVAISNQMRSRGFVCVMYSRQKPDNMLKLRRFNSCLCENSDGGSVQNVILSDQTASFLKTDSLILRELTKALK